MFEKGSKVQVRQPDTHAVDELLSRQTVAVLNRLAFTGQVTQIKGELFYVTFQEKNIRVTQVFKADELKAVD